MIDIVEYNKMVRMKMQEIITANGNTPSITGYPATDSLDKIKDKIKEEVEELLEAKSSDYILEEAADVIQIVIDYLKVIGYGPEELEVVRLAKEIKRGGFISDTGMIAYLSHVQNN